jgi:hypothetical protein
MGVLSGVDVEPEPVQADGPTCVGEALEVGVDDMQVARHTHHAPFWKVEDGFRLAVSKDRATSLAQITPAMRLQQKLEVLAGRARQTSRARACVTESHAAVVGLAVNVDLHGRHASSLFG